MPPRRKGTAAAGSSRCFLLTGPEQRAKEEALGHLIAERVAAEDRELDVEYLDAAAGDFRPDRVLQSALALGMFSSTRVIIVRHAERLKEPRHEESVKALAAALPGLPAQVTLVFVTGAEGDAGTGRAGRGSAGDVLAAAVRSHGEVKSFAMLRAEELAARAQAHAAEAGKRFRPNAAALLVRSAGPSLARVLIETDKLIDHAGGAVEITESEVATLIPAPLDESVFNLLTQAAAGNRQQAMTSLARLLESGEPPARVFPMLARTLRQLLQAKYLREQRVRPRQSCEDLSDAARTRLPPDSDIYATAPQPWQRERAWEQAARFTWPQLTAAFDALALADAGTKGWDAGPGDPEVALELFVVRMCDRGC